MVVEEFSIEEVQAATVEQCDEALALVEQLGLERSGQALCSRRTDGESPSDSSPYRKMTAREKWVYDIILPTKSKLENYADGAIPLRVLQTSPRIANGPHSLASEKADHKDPLIVLRDGSEYGKNANDSLYKDPLLVDAERRGVSRAALLHPRPMGRGVGRVWRYGEQGQRDVQG